MRDKVSYSSRFPCQNDYIHRSSQHTQFFLVLEQCIFLSFGKNSVKFLIMKATFAMAYLFSSIQVNETIIYEFIFSEIKDKSLLVRIMI